MFLPFDDSMAVILDDTNEVWPNCDNLILAERFLAFRDSNDELTPKYSGNNDQYLRFVCELLKKVHHYFYEHSYLDVKIILKELKFEILKGCEIVLSVIANKNLPPEEDYYWNLAKNFGATCSLEITNKTTHVVAANIGTKKTKEAVSKRIPVLHLLWLQLSTSFWFRLPEDYFSFQNIKNFDISAISNIPISRRLLYKDEEQEVYKKFKSQSSESESDAQLTE